MLGLYIIFGGLALGAVLISYFAVRADRKAHHTK
jgi:hypothetical protein